MKRQLSLLLTVAALLACLTACGSSDKDTERTAVTEEETTEDSAAAETDVSAEETSEAEETGITYPVEIENTLGVTVVEDEVNAIAVFDLGMLDILDTLGFGDRVVAVTHGNAFPDYLSEYESDSYINLGGFKDWDEEALTESNPDLIFAGFRQNKSIETVQAIAPTVYFSSTGDEDFMEMLELRVKAVTSLFGGEEEAQAQLEEIEEMLTKITDYIAENPTSFILVNCEDGGLSERGASNQPLLTATGMESLGEETTGGKGGDSGEEEHGGASQETEDGQEADAEGTEDAEVRGGGDGQTEGGRTESEGSEEAEAVDYTESNETLVESIVERQPDYIFVTDQDAAENEEGKTTAQEAVAATTLMDTYDEDHVVFVDNAVWNSASGGLTATKLQMETLMELFGIE